MADTDSGSLQERRRANIQRRDTVTMKALATVIALSMLFGLTDVAAQSIARPIVNPIDDTRIYPIAVWAMESRTAPAFAAMGVNIFVAGGGTVGWCDSLAASGVAGYVHWSSGRSEEDAEAIARSPGFLGWMHGDEPDNPEVVDDVFLITRRSPQSLQSAYDEMKASTTPAPMYLNLGQGLANGLAQSTPDSVYPEFCRTADIVCYDVYPTSTQERGTDRLHLTARGVERLRTFAGPDKPLWIWLECTQLNGSRARRGNRAPHPHELRAEVWMSIVHGADGIGYFPHQFNPYRGGPAAIPPPLQAEMALTNSLLHALAPVLRTGAMQRLAVDSRRGQISAARWQLGEHTLVAVVNMTSGPAAGRIELADTGPLLTPLGSSVRGPAHDRSLQLNLQPYEVALFTDGIELAIDSYSYPPPPPNVAAPSIRPSVATTVAELPLQPDREIMWSRTQGSRLSVPTLAKAPRLDGRLDDKAWLGAAPVSSWTNIAGQGVPELPTDGSIGIHDGRLYLAFRAAEDHLDSLVTRYDALWRNDCIELWFDPDNQRTSFSHIIITSDGRVETERTLPDHWGEAWRDENWRPRLEVTAGRDRGAWTLEISVPLADLGIDLDPAGAGVVIGFDAARERKTSGGENTVWTRGGFRAAGDFGELSFDAGRLALADGDLLNYGAESVSARVEIRVSGHLPTEPGAEWEQMWSQLAVEDRVVQVPAATKGRPGRVRLLDQSLAQRVPSDGLVRLLLRTDTADLLEEFVAHVPSAPAATE